MQVSPHFFVRPLLSKKMEYNLNFDKIQLYSYMHMGKAQNYDKQNLSLRDESFLELNVISVQKCEIL